MQCSEVICKCDKIFDQNYLKVPLEAKGIDRLSLSTNHILCAKCEEMQKTSYFIIDSFSQSLVFMKEIPNEFEVDTENPPLHFIKVFPVIGFY